MRIAKSRRLATLLICGLLLLGSEVSQAQPVTFGAETNISLAVGSRPGSVAIADFNGDGRPDIASGNVGDTAPPSAPGVSIFLQNANGSFSPAANSPIAAPGSPRSVAVGDVNGDGKLDLAVASFNSASLIDVSIFLGNGDGTFQAQIVVPVVVNAAVVNALLGDFNRDGKLDLVVLGFSPVENQVSLLLGNGNGTFGPAQNFGTGAPFTGGTHAIGDFNGDGKLDVAVPHANANNVGVLLGDGNGNLGAPTLFAVGGLGPTSVATADLDKDGILDLVTGDVSSGHISILFGIGDGTFEPATKIFVAANTFSVAIGDLNGDGNPDIGVVNGAILLGNGQGGFTAGASFGSGCCGPLAIGDLNRDGRPDLVLAKQNSNQIATYLNTTTFTPAGSFATAPNFVTGNNPYAVAVGDFNGDGKPDLAVSNNLDQNISILLGDGNAFFTTFTNLSITGPPSSIAIGDFNRDGKLDLAVAIALASPNLPVVSILLGNGNGSFGAPTNFPVGAQPQSVAVGDFNRDGKLDLAVVNYANASHNLSILLGNGDGTFAGTNDFTLSGPFSVTVGDFNRDGKQDLATANSLSNNIATLLGNGDGTFSDPANITVGSTPISVVVGDFNRDGKQDLAVSNYNGSAVAILLGDGNGAFSGPTNITVGNTPTSVVVGDFNRDGKQDLAVTNSVSNNVSLLLGNGDGTFTASANFIAGLTPFALAAGDFNLDGKSDLVIANNGSTYVSVLLNVAPSPPAITTTSVPAAIRGVAYNTQLVAASMFGPLSWTVVGGSLPAVINLSSTGLLSGTPTTAGIATVTVRATDVNGNFSERTFTVVVETGIAFQAPAGLISWWPGNGNSLDIQSGNNGVLQNGATFAAGKVGQAFSFDGVDDFISVPVTASLGMTSAYTFEAWVKFDETTFLTFRPLAVRGATNANDIEIYGQFVSHNLCVVHNRGNGGFFSHRCFVAPPLGTLFHLAVTWDGATIRAFYNGLEQVSGAGGQTLPFTSPLFTNKPWVFGTVDHFSFGNSIHKGLLDEISLYGRALSQAEIQSIVIAGSAGKGTPPVILTASAPPATRGFFYNEQLVAVSVLSPLTWSVVSGNLPAGMALSATGVISGTPTAVSMANFTVRVSAPNGAFVEKNFTIAVDPPPLPVATFTLTTNLSVGSFPRSVAVGDINRDGKADLVVVSRFANAASVFLGDGQGGFNPAVGSPLTVGEPFAVAMGDLNGDGKLDIVAGNDFLGGVLTIFLGTGTGSFGAPTTFASGGNSIGYIAIGDLNGDGKPDLAIAHRFSNNVGVLLGDGSGSFAPATNYAVGTGSRTVLIGDFNRDGKPDLAVTNQDTDDISILQGNGDGIFATPAINFFAGDGTFGEALGDFNRDGILDIAASNRLSHDVSVLFGTGQNPIGPGAFTPETVYQAGTGPFYMATADLNGDGKFDVITANSGSDDISILLGYGNGAFTYPITIPIVSGAFRSSPVWVAVEDLNRDGKPDIVVVNSANDTVSILLNTTTFAPAGSLGAPTNITVGTTPQQVAVGDFNRDGIPDLAVANVNSHNVSILLGNGNGAYASGPGSPLTLSVDTVRSLAVGDFNRDGKLDLAATVVDPNSVAILLGNGDGTFQAPSSVPLVFFGIVAIADLDGDGELDLAVVHGTCGTLCGGPPTAGNNVTILLGNGDGTFQAPGSNFITGGETNARISLAIGDFNRDGKPDLAINNNVSGDVSVVLQNSSGPFGFGPPTFYPTGFGAADVAVGDFNGDGKLDLAVPSVSQADLSILLGNGDGTFQSATSFSTDSAPLTVAVGDLNRDGKLDLAVAVYGDKTVAGLAGNGNGTFQPPVHFTVGSTGAGVHPGLSPHHVVIADVNRDGKPDVVTANAGDDNVSVLLNAVPTANLSISSIDTPIRSPSMLN